MPNSYLASSLTRSQNGLTLLVEGVSVSYLKDLKLVAATAINEKTMLMFRAKDRTRVNIELDPASGNRDSWLNLITAEKISLKDYSGELTEATIENNAYGLVSTSKLSIKKIGLLEGADSATEQQPVLKEDSNLSKMLKRAGIK